MGLISFDLKPLTDTIKKPQYWGTAIAVVLLIAGVAWWWTAREKRHRVAISSRDMLIVQLNNKWLECLNAPTDTVFYAVVVSDGPGEIVKPKPRRLFQKDSIQPIKPASIVTRENLADECPRGYYNDTTPVGKFKINWEAIGCIRSMRILDVSLDHKYMVVTKQHTIIQHDTVPVPAPSPWFRAGPYAGITLNSFTKFPGMELGAQVVVKDQLIISMGGTYINGFYANVRFGILFGK
jgi:hypothetical protein